MERPNDTLEISDRRDGVESTDQEAADNRFLIQEFIRALPPSLAAKFQTLTTSWVKDAEHILEDFRSRFTSTSALAHFNAWPPEAIENSDRYVQEMLGLIPGELREMEPKASLFVGTVLRLHGYNCYLQAHQDDGLGPAPADVLISSFVETGSGGLGQSWDRETLVQTPKNAKNAAAQRYGNRRRREDAEEAKKELTEIRLLEDEIDALLETMQRGKQLVQTFLPIDGVSLGRTLGFGAKN